MFLIFQLYALAFAADPSTQVEVNLLDPDWVEIESRTQSVCGELTRTGELLYVVAAHREALRAIMDGLEGQVDNELVGLQWRITQAYRHVDAPEKDHVLEVIQETKRSYRAKAFLAHEAMDDVTVMLLALNAAGNRRFHGARLRDARAVCVSQTLDALRSTTDTYALTRTAYLRIESAMDTLVLAYGEPKIIIYVPDTTAEPESDPAIAPLPNTIHDPDVRIGPLP